MKSCPGLAVPDSVHQVNVAAPCRLPRRRTTMRAAGSVIGTSMVSAASSTRDRGRGPDGSSAADEEGGTGALGAGAARGELVAAPRSFAASLPRSLAGLGGTGELELGAAACGVGEFGGAAARSAGGVAVPCSDEDGCGCVGEEDCVAEDGWAAPRERSDSGSGAADGGSESFAAVDNRFLSPPK